MRFFTSDHHFGHKNILKYQAETRYFRDTDHMRETLIKNWNAAISDDDEVFMLGDVAFNTEEVVNVLPRLNGKKWLVIGNHDPYFKLIAKGGFLSSISYFKAMGYAGVFEEALIRINGIGKVMLSHFPYWPSSPDGVPDYDLLFESQRPKRGEHALLLHGHLHTKEHVIRDDNGLMLDVGVDAWGMHPVSEDQIVDLWFKQSRFQEIFARFIAGEITKDQAVQECGLRDYAELIMAMGYAGFSLPTLPEAELAQQAAVFAKLLKGEEE